MRWKDVKSPAAAPSNSGNRLDKFLHATKNNYMLALIIFIGMGVIGISQFYDAAVNLISDFVPASDGLRVVDIRIVDDYDAVIDLKEKLGKTGIDTSKLSGEFPIVDILLRNVGDDPVILSSIEYIAKRKYYEDLSDHMVACMEAIVSEKYNLLLDVSKKEQEGTVYIAQIVPPKQADRFILIVGHTGSDLDPGERLARYRILKDITNRNERWLSWLMNYHSAEYDINLKLRFNEEKTMNAGSYSIKIEGPARCYPRIQKEDVIDLPGTSGFNP